MQPLRSRSRSLEGWILLKRTIVMVRRVDFALLSDALLHRFVTRMGALSGSSRQL
jgi:hypothetical protein